MSTVGAMRGKDLEHLPAWLLFSLSLQTSGGLPFEWAGKVARVF